jgi:hypothetical protein
MLGGGADIISRGARGGAEGAGSDASANTFPTPGRTVSLLSQRVIANFAKWTAVRSSVQQNDRDIAAAARGVIRR